MLKTVAKGSKEPLLVDVSDRLSLLTTLSGTKYEVYNVTGAAYKVGDGTYAGASAATSNDLTVIAVVDTASGGGWAVGTYALYVWFTVSGNNIRKGPFYFDVVA